MHVWRDRLYRWFSPLARRCPIPPNGVTLLALALNAGAAVLLARGWFLAAIGVIAVAGLADAFDGIVARVQGKESRFGDFLDHTADRLGDALLITGWLLGNGVRVEITAAAIIVVTLNGYVGTQIEATWHHRSYDGVGRGEFVLALIVFPIASSILQDNGWRTLHAAGLTIAEWMALALVAAAVLAILQRVARASRLETP